MKSRVMIIVGLLVLILFIPTIYFLASVPRGDINKMVSGYVESKIEKGSVSYTIVDNKPKNWRTLSQISAHAKNAILVSEDWAFYQHDGVDSAQLEKAIVEHFTEGKKLRGASTISQQLVKNLFLTNERSLNRKLKEFFITKYMESTVSKDKILEIYLNIIKYGKDLYGIQDASRFYFKKDASQLSAREGAFLAMLLPNPEKYSQSFRDKALSDYASQTVDKILTKMKQAKFLNEDDMKKAKSAKLGWARKAKTINSIGGNGRSRTGLSDGSEFEEQNKLDSDLSVDELKYDDDAMVEDLSGLEAEFQVED